MRKESWLAAVLAVVVLGMPGTAIAAPTLKPSKGSAPPRTEIQVSGSGLPADSELILTLAGEPTAATTDGDGDLGPVTVAVPADAAPGAYLIRVRDSEGTLLASARFLVRTNWPHRGRTSGHSGFNPYENVIDAGNVASLAPLWSSDSASVLSTAPVLAGGLAYVAGGRLTAIDAATGAERWSAPVAGVQSPAVEGGRVHATGSDGVLHTLDARTGAPLWTFEAPSGRPLSEPAVLGGKVFVAAEIDDDHGSGFVLEAATGDVISEGAPFTAGDFVFCCRLLAAWRDTAWTDVGDASISSGAFDIVPFGGSLTRFDSGSGGLNGFVVADSVLYSSNDNGRDEFGEVSARHVSQARGWQLQAGRNPSPPAVGGGRAYVSSFIEDDFGETGPPSVSAFASPCGPASCQPLWTTTLSAGARPSTPVVANGVVYVARAGEFLAFDADDGTPLWTSSGAGASGPPVVVDGRLYFTAGDKLHAWSPGGAAARIPRRG